MKDNEKLADELYGLVEREQGNAYISDGIGNLTEAEIYALARQSLYATERVARSLKRWLGKHGQLLGPTYSELSKKK